MSVFSFVIHEVFVFPPLYNQSLLHTTENQSVSLPLGILRKGQNLHDLVSMLRQMTEPVCDENDRLPFT